MLEVQFQAHVLFWRRLSTEGWASLCHTILCPGKALCSLILRCVTVTKKGSVVCEDIKQMRSLICTQHRTGHNWALRVVALICGLTIGLPFSAPCVVFVKALGSFLLLLGILLVCSVVLEIEPRT